MSLLITNHPDNTFIENLADESETEWLASVRRILIVTYGGRIPWWLNYGAGPVATWCGRDYRCLRCIAGSVSAMLMLRAIRGELDRAMMVIGGDADDRPLGQHWVGGREEEFDASFVLLQLGRAPGSDQVD